MADVKTVDEGVEFPEKRKLDLPNSINKAPEVDNDKFDSNKKQKFENNGSDQHSPDSKETHQNVAVTAAEVEDEDEDDEEDCNAEQDEDGEDEQTLVDRKGKGIMRDDKGKGKMVEESEDDDDGDDSDGNDDSSDDSDSDFSDGLGDDSDIEEDPLAEVDLDNILPSRTRQHRAQPGVRISSHPAKGNDA